MLRPQGENTSGGLSGIAGEKTMQCHARSPVEIDNALAFFTVDQHCLRVEVATDANRDGCLGALDLDGVCYVLILNPESDIAIARLTRREREIAVQIARGRGTKQIAYDLGISPHTTLTYVNHIRAKLGVHNRPEMVAVLLGGIVGFQTSRSQPDDRGSVVVLADQPRVSSTLIAEC
jgi:DNA-binding CsgD family transcriptional regulator